MQELTAVVGPDPLVIAHLEGVEDGWYVDLPQIITETKQTIKRTILLLIHGLKGPLTLNFNFKGIFNKLKRNGWD